MSTVADLVTVDPAALTTRPPFSDLFPIDRRTFDAVKASMSENGYDQSRPINVWTVGDVVVDGHTRLKAARELGLDVPICLHDFKDEDEAFEYAVRSQVERRNLTDSEIFRVVKEMDRRKTAGRPCETHKQEFPTSDGNNQTSASVTAKKVGTSPRKVEAVRTIADNAATFPDIARDVEEGKKSIRTAAREVGDRKRKAAAVYTPVIPPAAAYDAPPPSASAVVAVTDPDRLWLESHPLRARVVARRFDEDALIYRRFSTALGGLRAELQQLIGLRADDHASTLYRALLRVSPLPAINTWTVCEKCHGTGANCRTCRGGGYVIPGL